MLKSKIAMALAAAMVMATLYGCSSGVSDSTHNEVKSQVSDLQGALDAVADALGLPAGSSEADILAALVTATADQLVAIRTQLELADDATSMAIVDAIDALQTEQGALAKVVAELGLPEGASEAEILAALDTATEDQLVSIRTQLELADDATSMAIVAAIDALQITAADLKTEYLHEQAVVAGINQADDAMRPNDGGTNAATNPFETVAVAFDLKVTAGELEAAGDAPDADLPVQAMLSKMDEADGTTTTNKAFVYSTREAPGALAWTKYYDMADRAVDGGSDNAPGMAAVASTQGLDDEGADTNTAEDIVNYKITFGTDVSSASALFMASAFPSADSQTYNYSADPDGDATTDDDNRKFMGSFHGVMGEYECTDTCTAITNAKSELITFSGTWTFTPADGTDMVMGVDEDSTYVYFGYWLRQVVDDEGDEMIGVNHFSGGSGPIAVADMASINCEGIASGSTCTATYEGKAGGKYAVKTVTSRNEVATLHTGQFVADVTLNAMFGGDSVAVVNHDRIEGEMTGFNDAADAEDRINHWEVTLGAASTSDATDNANVGATNGGMMGGTWTHTFYNRPAADADTTDISEENMPPGDVAGTFDAHWSDGHAIGAYGASRQ